MDWLILTESLEKSSAFRAALPNALCLSSQGMPWTLEVELSNSNIYYVKRLKANAHLTITKIKEQALKADKILLAFEQTRLGEAIAFEFQELLGIENCCRWTHNTLHKKAIQLHLSQAETLTSQQMAKCRPNVAKSYWCLSTINLTWTNKIQRWLKEKYDISERITFHQIAIMHSIYEEATKRENYFPQKYYELILELKAQSNQSISAFPVNPPEHVLKSLPSSSRKFWKKKRAQPRVDCPHGFGLPQPNYPLPWRFQTEPECHKYKAHYTKFPYFIVDHLTTSIRTNIKPACLYSSLLLDALDAGYSQADSNIKALMELYYEGHISYPKSDNPNLFDLSLKSMHEFCEKRGQASANPPRKFEPEFKSKRQEAIRPCDWNKTPTELAILLKESELKPVKVWMYTHIWNRSLDSQKPDPNESLCVTHLSGPLPISPTSSSGNKTEVKTTREQRFDSPLSLCLRSESPIQNLRTKEILEVTHSQIIEKTTTRPGYSTKEDILLGLYIQGRMKPQTLEKSFQGLLTQKLITDAAHPKLTARGKEIHSNIYQTAGLFLDQEFLKEVNASLEKIETGEEDASDFLQEWWYKLNVLLS